MSAEKSADTALQHFIGVFTSFDPSIVMPLLGPDPTLEFPFAPEGVVPGLISGRDDCAEFLRTTGRMFRELHACDVSMYPMRAEGLAMARWRSEGVTGGSRAREYRNTYISLAQVSDGLIDWYCEYFDPLAGMRAFERA